MANTNDDAATPPLTPTTPPEYDEETGISIPYLDGPQDNAPLPREKKKDSAVSEITWGLGASTAATNRSTNAHEISPGRAIKTEDVQNIFRGSTTTCTVSFDQIDRIKRMHDKISSGVHMDFNYICLLVVASVVAALGLAVDSSTTVISSMLLSPIMGPVIGMSYGLIIWDIPLIKRSARNELLSILVCVVFGLIVGASCVWTQMAHTWPTNEMLSRGTRETFLCGIPIAFFSGLGVALSVLDDHTSSLVGVAISASLLPPAVNCGMLFIVAAVTDDDWSNYNFKHNIYEHLAEETGMIDGAMTFSSLGITSFFLTIANVIMVGLGATLMFRAKEVLPVTKKVFWDDLKTARRIYQGRALDSVTGEPLSTEQIRVMLS